jgi:chromosome segregation ATPase
MKNFLQGLLIFFSLCLCALIAFQWVRETRLRQDRQTHAEQLHEKMEALQDLELRCRHLEAEIQRLDALKLDLVATVKTNRLEIDKWRDDLLKAEGASEVAERQLAAYKAALQAANDNITNQNESIKRQNIEMKQLTEERNDLAKKFNKLATEYSDLARRWNQVQEELAAQATNAPARK